MAKIAVDAVVFDKGNTLIMDPFDCVLDSRMQEFVDILAYHGLIYGPDEIRRTWSEANRTVHYQFAAHFYQEAPMVADALARLGVTGAQDAVVRDLLDAYRDGYSKLIASDPRTAEVKYVLVRLRERGKRLGIFSNDRIEAVNMEIHVMGADGLFDYVQTSETVGIEKPDPRVFRHIAGSLGLPHGRIAYVGDNPAMDIGPAKTEGFRTVLYLVDPAKYAPVIWRNYQEKSAHEPDAVIRSLSELLNVIE